MAMIRSNIKYIQLCLNSVQLLFFYKIQASQSEYKKRITVYDHSSPVSKRLHAEKGDFILFNFFCSNFQTITFWEKQTHRNIILFSLDMLHTYHVLFCLRIEFYIWEINWKKEETKTCNY